MTYGRALILRATGAALCVGCNVVANLGDPRVSARLDGGSPDDAAAPGAVDDGSPDDGPPVGAEPDTDSAGAEAGTLQAAVVALGSSHACAVIRSDVGSPENGTVRCWGSNAQGQLGSGGPSTAIPREVVWTGPSAMDLALGLDSSCAITAGATTGGYLACWGAVLDTDPAGVHRLQDTPAELPSEMTVGSQSRALNVTTASVKEGGCGLTVDSLLCWGNVYATVATIDSGGTPPALSSFYSVGSASVGYAHACALTSDGSNDVACWGDDSRGQTGHPQGSVSPLIPTRLGLSDLGGAHVVQIASGAYHSCARLENHSVYCWGANDRGQLGAATTGDAFAPVRVAFQGALDALQIALGDDHSCALMSDDTVECWGDNASGQLGHGLAPTFSASPLVVWKAPNYQLNYAASIAAGGGTTCVTREGFAVFPVACWGRNDAGQAGQPASMPVVAFATGMNL